MRQVGVDDRVLLADHPYRDAGHVDGVAGDDDRDPLEQVGGMLADARGDRGDGEDRGVARGEEASGFSGRGARWVTSTAVAPSTAAGASG